MALRVLAGETGVAMPFPWMETLYAGAGLGREKDDGINRLVLLTLCFLKSLVRHLSAVVIWMVKTEEQTHESLGLKACIAKPPAEKSFSQSCARW